MSKAIKRARKLKPKPNYVSAIVSVSLVLFILGLFFIVSFHTNHLADYFKERINIIVELTDNATQRDVDAIVTYIKQTKESKGQSVEHISKDEALDLLKEDFGEDILLLDMPNPLFDVIVFNVKGEYLNTASLLELRTGIKNFSNKVSDVYYQETLINSIVHNVERVSYFLLILALVIGLISLVIIFNSIKLALYANRKLIKNMELIGASWGFIRRPFILRAIVHGLISVIIALILLGAVLYYAYSNYNEILVILDVEIILMTMFGVVVAGLLINIISTFLITTKYLKMSFDDLF